MLIPVGTSVMEAYLHSFQVTPPLLLEWKAVQWENLADITSIYKVTTVNIIDIRSHRSLEPPDMTYENTRHFHDRNMGPGSNHEDTDKPKLGDSLSKNWPAL